MRFAAKLVLERGSDQILLARRVIAGSTWRGDQQPVDDGRARRRHRAVAGNVGNGLLVGYANEELCGKIVRVGGDRYGGTVLLRDPHRDVHVGERGVIKRVVDLHRRFEGLSLQRQLLLDLDLDACADGLLGLCHANPKQCCKHPGPSCGDAANHSLAELHGFAFLPVCTGVDGNKHLYFLVSRAS